VSAPECLTVKYFTLFSSRKAFNFLIGILFVF
jgi:hypothetical protein